MKIIDWESKGNLVRFYLAKDEIEEWWGDDWDDAPYEHNAGTVYNEYVDRVVDVAFRWNTHIYEAGLDWRYNGNSPFSKEDFQNRKAPMLVLAIGDDYSYWANDYSQLIGSEENENIVKLYMGDSADRLQDLISFGVIINAV